MTSQQATDTPSDIYSPHQKNLELFVKTNFQNRGKDLGGIVWEEDPVRHREVAKKLSPAFSSRSIKALEPLAHEYMDYFVAKMKELGSEHTGVGLMEWTNWLAMDQAADMAWNEKLHQMRDRRLSKEVACPNCLVQLTRPREKFGTSRRPPRLQRVCHGHASL